jgi:hypothetical protein
MSNTFECMSNPWPRCSHMVSFSPVYNQVGWAHCWSGMMHFDKKSNNTIIDISPLSARNWIL